MSKQTTPQFTPKRLVPTAEQSAIQIAPKKIVLIDANAGAAKTTTLALRIAESLYRGRQPERTLALVFTAAAKLAMRQRLAEIGLAAHVIKRLTIATFDELAGSVLVKLEGGAVPAIDNDEALRPYALEAIELVAQRYGERYELEVSMNNTAVAQFLKLQLRTKARFDLHRAGFGHDTVQASLAALDISHTHYLWLREYERLRGSDAGETQFRARFDATYDLVRLLEDDTPLRSELPEYQVIVADELHDLNEASFRLLTMLIRRGNAFFCGAGDRDQVIYTWAGADHQFLSQRFEQEFPQLQRYPLTSSYRYGPELAQAVGALKRKASSSALARGTRIELVGYDADAPDDCAEQLVAALRRWQADGGGLGAAAIVLRDRDQSIRVENALFRHGIGYHMVDMHSYLGSQEILMLRGLVAIARQDLHSIKSGARRGEMLEALVVFAEIPFNADQLRQAREDVSTYPELLEGFLTNQLAKSANRDKAGLTLAAVEYLRALEPQAPAGPALRHVASLMQLDRTARRLFVDPAQAKVVAASIGGFIEVCAESATAVGGFSRWLGDIEHGLADSKKADRVTIACVDQIKGLEYAHVLLPYLALDAFPRALAEPREEENRFYVAVTRARERLTLLAPEPAALRSPYLAAMRLEHASASGSRLLRKNVLRQEIGARAPDG
ncbi:MAG: ATP-dependent helicase [Pseudomonadota bacterium]